MSDNININASKAILLIAGVEICPRTNGYLPMAFLQAGGKQYKDLTRDFNRNGRLSQLLDAEAAKVNLPTFAKSDDFSARGLIENNTKTKKHFVGFLHPRAAHVISLNWFPPPIASLCSEWCYQFLAGSVAFAKEVLDQADASNCTKSLTTRTTVDAHEPDASLAAAHIAAATAHGEAMETGLCTNFLASEGKRRRLDDTLVFDLSFVESLSLLDQRWDMVRDPPAKCKYVYFLRMEGTQYVKIGFSADVQARLRHLQIGNAIPLKLEYKFKTQSFREHESSLHCHLHACHVQGEWFKLPQHTDFPHLVSETLPAQSVTHSTIMSMEDAALARSESI